jgi:enoyl-CoA hydratase
MTGHVSSPAASQPESGDEHGDGQDQQAQDQNAQDPRAYDTLRVRYEGPLCRITLDRPGKGNALSPLLLNEIDAVLADVTGNREAKVVILAGAGRGFCAGHELGRERGADDVMSVLARMHRTFATLERIWSLPRPVIASVHGYCIGAATQLAAVCDLIAVSSDVEIGLPKLPMGAGLTPPLLALSVGVRRARQLAYDIGSSIDGATAVSWGWANTCSDPDQLDADVTALALRIARAPLAVLAGQKASLNKVADLQGFWQAATVGVEMDAMHHFARTGAATGEAIRELGVKGALAAFKQGQLGGA